MIRVQNLGKQFNSQWLFRNLSFSVEASRTTVIIGPSGSGKSVLLKMLAGLIPVDEGDIQLQTQNIGMLFQKNALFDSLSVEENLTFPLMEVSSIEKKDAQEKAHDLLKKVGLSHAIHLFPNELSGGMQKRLGIARALIVEPEILFYDEPTAGLDPVTSKMIAELIIQFRKTTKSALIVVTNDVHRAFQMGDQIYLLADGKLSGGGTAAETRQTSDPAMHRFIMGIQ